MLHGKASYRKAPSLSAMWALRRLKEFAGALRRAGRGEGELQRRRLAEATLDSGGWQVFSKQFKGEGRAAAWTGGMTLWAERVLDGLEDADGEGRSSRRS